MKIHTYLLSTIVALLAIALFLSIGAAGEDDEEMYKMAHYNLKAGDDLSMQVAEEGASAETRTVQAEYTGIPGVVGADRQWVDVGTWTSHAGSTGTFEVNGSVTFNLFVAEVQHDFNNNADFEFTLSVDGSQVAQVTTTHFTSTSITEVTATTGAVQFPVTNDTEISVYIRYRGWNDIRVYYDNYDMDSGFRASMNPIKIIKYKTGTNSASVKFADRSGVDWSQSAYCSRIFANGSEMEAEYSVMPRDSITEGNDSIPVYEIEWHGMVNNESHLLNISLSYSRIRDPVNDTTWFLSGKSSGGGGGSDDDDDFFDSGNMVIFGGLGLILLLVVIGLVVLKKKGGKKASPADDFTVEEEDEETYGDSEDDEEDEEYDDSEDEE